MAWSIFTNGGGPLVAVGWAKDLLKKIGAPVTPGNIEFIYQWEKSEGGGGKYNPLNQGPVQGKPYLTTTGSQFGGGAADYASWEAGLQGSYDYLHYGHYAKVLSSLKANNPTAARAALIASPWAASHYNFGAGWANVAVPGGTPILPPAGAVAETTGAGATSSSSPDTCAWNFSLPQATSPSKLLNVIPLPSFSVGGQSFCLISKVQLRQTIGFGLVVAGGVVLLAGVFLLVGVEALSLVGGPKVLGAAARSTSRATPKVTATKATPKEDRYGRHAA
jgi:hypothetical protein